MIRDPKITVASCSASYIRAGTSASSDELLFWATFPHEKVRTRVAENPVSPPEILAALSSDSHPEVRIAVSENPATPLAIIEQLIMDISPDVRFALAENPYIPSFALKQLTDDENPYVRARAERTLGTL